jgi:hypothetical protein
LAETKANQQFGLLRLLHVRNIPGAIKLHDTFSGPSFRPHPQDYSSFTSLISTLARVLAWLPANALLPRGERRCLAENFLCGVSGVGSRLDYHANQGGRPSLIK